MEKQKISSRKYINYQTLILFVIVLTTCVVSDEDSNDQEISTVEEEELSALMGEKEDYKAEEEPSDEEWED